MKFDELLASLTDDDGIPADFIEGIRIAYDEDVQSIRAEHESAISELSSSHEAALESLGTDHAAELERVRNDAFENINSGDNFPETVGDEEIDENLDFDNFWEEAE